MAVLQWNADLYQAKHGFVAAYGQQLLEWVPQRPDQIILDVGCGTGKLTQALADKGRVMGVDSSPEMVEKARRQYPALHFEVRDACRLGWQNMADVVFSNAVFHWIPCQEELLNSLWTALKPGGLLVAEMGAAGNIAQIEEAFSQAVQQMGGVYHSPFYFPETQKYDRLLRQAGFEVQALVDYDRPTPLMDGENGMANWIRQFFASTLAPMPGQEQEQVIDRTQQMLRPRLWDGAQWVADYRRLRILAKKPPAVNAS